MVPGQCPAPVFRPGSWRKAPTYTFSCAQADVTLKAPGHCSLDQLGFQLIYC